MKTHAARYLSLALVATASFAIPACAADNLLLLKINSTVQLFTSRDQVGGHQLLCEAKVEGSWPDVLTVRITSKASVCGMKGELLHIPKARVRAIVPDSHLTKGRVIARLTVIGALVAAVASVSIFGSDPEDALISANPVILGGAVWGGWKAVPAGTKFNIAMECSDSAQCFP